MTTPLHPNVGSDSRPFGERERGNAGRADEAADAHIPTPDVRGIAFVRETTALRREPTEARTIESKNKKRQANVMTLLQRGEQVEVLEAVAGFVRIKLSDETTGWAKATGIRVAPTLSAATTLRRLHCFLRPDLLAMEAARTVEPGSILFVLREKDSFSEIDAGPLATYWVLTDALERDAECIEAAKVFGRARALAQSDADKAKPLFDLLRSRFSGTRLVQQLVGEEHVEMPATTEPGGPSAASGEDANARVRGEERLPAHELESMQAPLAPPPEAELPSEPNSHGAP